MNNLFFQSVLLFLLTICSGVAGVSTDGVTPQHFFADMQSIRMQQSHFIKALGVQSNNVWDAQELQTSQEMKRLSLEFAQQTNKWIAPVAVDKYKNPLANDPKATAAGKKLYIQMCAVCHGNKGRGDGPGGINLKPRPADHTSEDVQKQSDGALFWKMSVGRPPMAAYKDILTVTQRWQLVNFIRTLKK